MRRRNGPRVAELHVGRLTPLSLHFCWLISSSRSKTESSILSLHRVSQILVHPAVQYYSHAGARFLVALRGIGCMLAALVGTYDIDLDSPCPQASTGGAGTIFSKQGHLLLFNLLAATESVQIIQRNAILIWGDKWISKEFTEEYPFPWFCEQFVGSFFWLPAKSGEIIRTNEVLETWPWIGWRWRHEAFLRPVATKLCPKLPVLQSAGTLLTGAISACTTAIRPTRSKKLTVASPPKQKHMPFLSSMATGIVGMLSSKLPTRAPTTSGKASTFGLPMKSLRPLTKSKSGFKGSNTTRTSQRICRKDGWLPCVCSSKAPFRRMKELKCPIRWAHFWGFWSLFIGHLPICQLRFAHCFSGSSFRKWKKMALTRPSIGLLPAVTSSRIPLRMVAAGSNISVDWPNQVWNSTTSTWQMSKKNAKTQPSANLKRISWRDFNTKVTFSVLRWCEEDCRRRSKKDPKDGIATDSTKIEEWNDSCLHVDEVPEASDDEEWKFGLFAHSAALLCPCATPCAAVVHCWTGTFCEETTPTLAPSSGFHFWVSACWSNFSIDALFDQTKFWFWPNSISNWPQFCLVLHCSQPQIGPDDESVWVAHRRQLAHCDASFVPLADASWVQLLSKVKKIVCQRGVAERAVWLCEWPKFCFCFAKLARIFVANATLFLHVFGRAKGSFCTFDPGLAVGWRDLLVVQKISLSEIVSTCSAAASCSCRSLESSVLLTQLHFKLSTGAHMPLMECQMCQLCFQHTPSEMWIHVWIQIFGLCVRCRLVLWWQPHCSTVCKVATAPLLQTKIALSRRALPKLHGLYHQHCHPIKRLLSLLLTHHFLMMDVDCHLTCASVIPIQCWQDLLLSHKKQHCCWQIQLCGKITTCSSTEQSKRKCDRTERCFDSSRCPMTVCCSKSGGRINQGVSRQDLIWCWISQNTNLKWCSWCQNFWNASISSFPPATTDSHQGHPRHLASHQRLLNPSQTGEHTTKTALHLRSQGNHQSWQASVFLLSSHSLFQKCCSMTITNNFALQVVLSLFSFHPCVCVLGLLHPNSKRNLLSVLDCFPTPSSQMPIHATKNDCMALDFAKLISKWILLLKHINVAGLWVNRGILPLTRLCIF